MAEQYFHDTMAQNGFNKADGASLEKWKSVSETAGGSENNLTGSFDCNICLDSVQDPVITLCGHLYCWPCIYKWIYYQSASSENPEKQLPQCPVCKTEVSENTLVPLYGRCETTKPSERKAVHLGMVIPRRPPSPRCGVNTLMTNATMTSPRQLHHRDYQQPQQPYLGTPMPSLGGLTDAFNQTAPVLGEIVYARIFGNPDMTLYTYPNSYSLAGMSTSRARRQAMQVDRSLSRLCFFFLCCAILCLLLF